MTTAIKTTEQHAAASSRSPLVQRNLRAYMLTPNGAWAETRQAWSQLTNAVVSPAVYLQALRPGHTVSGIADAVAESLVADYTGPRHSSRAVVS